MKLDAATQHILNLNEAIHNENSQNHATAPTSLVPAASAPEARLTAHIDAKFDSLERRLPGLMVSCVGIGLENHHAQRWIDE